jgi:hypothetical protein
LRLAGQRLAAGSVAALRSRSVMSWALPRYPVASIIPFGVAFGVAVVAFGVAPVRAGVLAGKLDLPPPPERPAIRAKGFLDRAENALAPLRPFNVNPLLVVAIEGAGTATPAQVNWELVGESFARPVIIVPVGAEVVIKNTSLTARTLTAAENEKLLEPPGPINPGATKNFRPSAPGIYTIGDPAVPHLRGKVVVVATPFVSAVDDAGKFEIADIPEGSYQAKVYFYNPASELPVASPTPAAAGVPGLPPGAGMATPGPTEVVVPGGPSRWLDVKADITVVPKGRSEVTVKVPPWGSAVKK